MRSTFQVQSFSPIEAPDARILILGTMPGQASLAQAAYYAHPRNAFWPIMLTSLAGASLDFTAQRQWDYARRSRLLVEHRIALWDVLAECVRPGSLDSSIAPDSAKPNDLAGFVASHNELQRLIFNGQSAAKLYHRHAAGAVAAALERQNRTLDTCTLPSTSPAMAMKSLKQKHELWQPAVTDE